LRTNINIVEHNNDFFNTELQSALAMQILYLWEKKYIIFFQLKNRCCVQWVNTFRI